MMEDFDTDSLSSGKKVRFDLNDEIFVIPNKWDRLSRRAGTGKESPAEESCKASKTNTTEVERRGKSKQRSKKVKKSTKSSPNRTSTTRAPTSPSSQTLEIESSVLSTKTTKTFKSSCFETKAKKTGSPEVKLKLSHRNNKELSQDDIVLPRINYNSELKKAIEHAVVRNRTSNHENGGSMPHERNNDGYGYSSLTTRPHSDLYSSTNSSTFDEQEEMLSGEECVLVLPEGGQGREPKFSELSRNVESWSPFLNGQSKDSKTKREHKMSSALVMIPNSILY